MDKNFSIKKTNPVQPGYIWVPYIIVNKPTIVTSEGFSPKNILTSRYSQVMVSSKSFRRKKHITDVLASIV